MNDKLPAVLRDPDERHRRWRGPAAIGIGLVVAGLIGGWALTVVLAPAQDVLESPGYTLVEARRGTVEQSLRLNTLAQWEPASIGQNQAVGVVTTVDIGDATVAKPGVVVYTVDLRPVVVAAGEIPAFRDLVPAARGRDVEQLQRMLAVLGLYSGSANGIYDSRVIAAVKNWQRGLGIRIDGVVRQGDIIFVPKLPTRVALDAKLVVGVSLSGGEPAVEVLPDAPLFTIALPDQQAKVVAPGMSVAIEHGGRIWQAEIARLSRQQDGYVAVLAGGGENTICGEECDSIPHGDNTLLPSTIRVVEPVTGITVPALAVVTAADGRTGVQLADGTFQQVVVVASANGVAVVEGLGEGVSVRAPGGTQ